MPFSLMRFSFLAVLLPPSGESTFSGNNFNNRTFQKHRETLLVAKLTEENWLLLFIVWRQCYNKSLSLSLMKAVSKRLRYKKVQNDRSRPIVKKCLHSWNTHVLLISYRHSLLGSLSYYILKELEKFCMHF